VKISALPSATTPLSGSEIVPIIQLNGGTNRTSQATINSVIYSATLLANAAQNYATGVSNILGALNNNFNVTSNMTLTFTNFLQNFSNATATTLNQKGGLYFSNSVLLANVLDAGTMARENTNTFYRSANPSGYQVASQVTNIVNEALSSANIAQSNTVASFTGVVTPTAYLGGKIVSPATGSTNVTIDLSRASFQQLDFSSGNSQTTVNFYFTNQMDGQNVWLLCTATNRVAWKGAAFGNNGGGVIDSWGNNTFTVSAPNATNECALLNWQVIGGRVIFTVATHP
jgi:hypothetical protein